MSTVMFEVDINVFSWDECVYMFIFQSKIYFIYVSAYLRL